MINEIIQKSIDNPDDFIIGFADLNGILADSTFRFGLVIGKRLDDKIIDSIINGPTLEYFHYSKAVNAELSELIHKIADSIINIGFDCKIIEPSIDKVVLDSEDYKFTLRTPVSHKMIGTRAGLGWIGKTDLFISKKFGSRLRLVSLLTDYPFEISELPVNRSKCGKCNLCVTNCPANAATGQLWDINTDRDIFFDALKCRDKCVELSKKHLNLDSMVCGMCVLICPIGILKQNS
jgi:epoxyqueuosine reductase